MRRFRRKQTLATLPPLMFILSVLSAAVMIGSGAVVSSFSTFPRTSLRSFEVQQGWRCCSASRQNWPCEAGTSFGLEQPLRVVVQSTTKPSSLRLKVPNSFLGRTRPAPLHSKPSSSSRTESTSKDGGDAIFDGKNTITLIGAQGLLILASILAAAILGTPNYGLGPTFHLDEASVTAGAVYTLPLFVLSFVLDSVEKYVPALQDVTKATQRSVLGLLGEKRKPLVALATAVALGFVAGLGEEMLFRGVLQTELSTRFGSTTFALTASSILFGALHAVTPLYAVLASLASVFFGVLYVNAQGNLAVPIVCHGLYDVGALLWAHWTVTGMSEDERTEIVNWRP